MNRLMIELPNIFYEVMNYSYTSYELLLVSKLSSAIFHCQHILRAIRVHIYYARIFWQKVEKITTHRKIFLFFRELVLLTFLSNSLNNSVFDLVFAENE